MKLIGSLTKEQVLVFMTVHDGTSLFWVMTNEAKLELEQIRPIEMHLIT